MTADRSTSYLQGLVRELCKLPRETEWVEFKANNDNPAEIGEYLSALANAAALAGKARAYLLWGVRDDDHALVGTTFDPATARKGNEELESWLLRLLEPRIDFRFDAVEVDGHRVVLLEIAAAQRHPVRFSGVEYIRVGTYKKPLKDYPEKERALWRMFDRMPFEAGIAAQHLPSSDVLRLLDAPAFFDLLRQPLPDGHQRILEGLADNALVAPCPAGGWDITNLGAVLLAHRLADFPGLARKAVRLIVYRGATRIATEREIDEPRGYALCLDDVVRRLVALLPSREVLDGAFQRARPDYPEAALRELVANALIHQDFTVTGAGPMVEVFDGRVEVTNPGEPLVPTDRFLDSPPRSRNDALAATMRRLDLCEERGSGIDKVLLHVEASHLPAPSFQVPPGFTRVMLFGPRPLTGMPRPERIQVCYWHASLRHLHGEALTNASLRERFGMDDASRSLVSRHIREAVDAGVIRAVDPDAGPKHMRYLPWWA
jgi:ATP-dependent DNA helicase RecG